MPPSPAVSPPVQHRRARADECAHGTAGGASEHEQAGAQLQKLADQDTGHASRPGRPLADTEGRADWGMSVKVRRRAPAGGRPFADVVAEWLGWQGPDAQSFGHDLNEAVLGVVRDAMAGVQGPMRLTALGHTGRDRTGHSLRKTNWASGALPVGPPGSMPGPPWRLLAPELSPPPIAARVRALISSRSLWAIAA